MASKKDEAVAITAIDPNNLDKECVSLPGAYLQYAFIAAEAKRDAAEERSAMDAIVASIGQQVRTKPEKFGLVKATVDSVNAMVLVQEPYIQARDAHAKALHRSEMAQAVVWALEHKKRSLTLLVDLHGMGYFSDVKMTPEGKDAVENEMKSKVRRRHQPKNED